MSLRRFHVASTAATAIARRAAAVNFIRVASGTASVILIFSIAGDQSTTDVMRWLQHLGREDVIRLNEEDLRAGALALDVRNGRADFILGKHRFHSDEVTSVWYRKGDFQLLPPPAPLAMDAHPGLAERLVRKVRAEGERLSEYVHSLLERAPRVLGHPRVGRLNKLVVLEQARAVGLEVPTFLGGNRRDAFLSFATEGGAVVKAASDGMYLWDFDAARRGYFSYTERLSAELLVDLPEQMPPSFAQSEVAKLYEVRVFYLDGVMHSMAILSQNDAQTSLDYRKYNYAKPNRNLPYALPDEVGACIDALFRALGLNTGSVDLIVDAAGRHVFLEINPSGQYAVMAHACNFALDLDIARWLAAGSEAA